MSNEGDDAHDDVASFAEEAGKLFEALSGWAQEHAGEGGTGLSGLAEQVAASAHDLNDHLATGAAECTVCPICRGVHAVRQLSPEVKAHLASAAASLVQAATTLMATQVPEDMGTADGDRFDLDDEWPADG